MPGPIHPSSPPPTSASGMFPAGTFSQPKVPAIDTYATAAEGTSSTILSAFEAFHLNTKPQLLLNALNIYSRTIADSPDDERLEVMASCRQLLTHPRLTVPTKRKFSRIYAALLDFLPPTHPRSVTEALAATSLTYEEELEINEAPYLAMQKLKPPAISSDDVASIDRLVIVHAAALNRPFSLGLEDPHFFRLMTLLSLRVRTKPDFDISPHIDTLTKIHEDILPKALKGKQVILSKPRLMAYFRTLSNLLGNTAYPFFASALANTIDAVFQALADVLEDDTPENQTQVFALCDIINTLQTHLPRNLIVELLPAETLDKIKNDILRFYDELNDENHFIETPATIINCEFAVIAALQAWFIVDDPFGMYGFALGFNDLLLQATDSPWSEHAQTVANILSQTLTPEEGSDEVDSLEIKSVEDLLALVEKFAKVLTEYDTAISCEQSPANHTTDNQGLVYSPFQRWKDSIRALIIQAHQGLIKNPDDLTSPLDLSDPNIEVDLDDDPFQAPPKNPILN